MGDVIRIMVVDDEAGICRNVEKILTKNNYAVTSANSARQALEIMAEQSFNLLITDIVMPRMNGLELLKKVKTQWPQTKALTMTAFASTDTAVRAIRLGALDYLPKPFTPKELRSMVADALSGKLIEAKVSPEEMAEINVIDVDVPFDMDEVAGQTGADYARMLGRSDMPVVEVKADQPLEGFCEVGVMVCDIFKKLGATCKAGVKTSVCPQKKAPTGKAEAKAADVRTLVGIDQPFSYEEIVQVTGPEYVQHLQSDGVVISYYEELKQDVARMLGKVPAVGAPADAEEIAPSGEVQVAITASEAMEGFCQTGTMVCDIFKKLGATCKAGTKTGVCPQLKARQKKAAADEVGFDGRRMISVDMPFDIREVAAITGSEYLDYVAGDGLVQIPYEQLKANYRQAQADLPGRSLQKGHPVLVIDDEVAVNNNIRKILAKSGYAVDQANTKQEALAKIDRYQYVLILLDLKLPGVQGLELLQYIGASQPSAKVIMITGYASIETAKEAARMGAVEYLPKPFTPEEIRNATERAFKLAA
jgi:DNA-binding response OmpR family regulator